MSLLAILPVSRYLRGKSTPRKFYISIQMYDPELDNWSEYTMKCPKPMKDCIAASDNQLFFIDESSPPEIYRYDILKWQWHKLSEPSQSPNTGKVIAGAFYTMHNNNLYAMGGYYANENSSEQVKRWHPDTDTWETLEDLTIARDRGKATIYYNFIFVAGGQKRYEELRYTEMYNTLTSNGWRRRADMGESRWALGLSQHFESVYACGGYNNGKELNLVQRYNVKSNKWTTVSPLNQGRAFLDCITFNNRLWAIGGVSYPEVFNNVEQFNEKTNEWIKMKPLIRGGPVKCVILPTRVVTSLNAKCLLPL